MGPTVTNRFPARIHVLLARDAPVGLVIRRGPSKQACTILWDRETDTFQLGQWLKGRIYERRSDLSPDGKYFIYFAMNGKWHTDPPGAWTAISRAPYLKALVFMAKGDCWHGGGLFLDNRTYWINEGYGHHRLWDSELLHEDMSYEPSQYFGGGSPGVYFPRLLRDGWKLVQQVSLNPSKHYDLFEKPAHEGWLLRKFARAEQNPAPGHGCYWDEHELSHPETQQRIPCPDWVWADRNGKRLVWASRGKLFAGKLRNDGFGEPKELHDFNDMKFQPIKAPY
jgi:hypothetical protein